MPRDPQSLRDSDGTEHVTLSTRLRTACWREHDLTDPANVAEQRTVSRVVWVCVPCRRERARLYSRIRTLDRAYARYWAGLDVQRTLRRRREMTA